MYSFSFYYDKTNHAILIVNKNSLLYSKLSSIVFNLKNAKFHIVNSIYFSICCRCI